MVEISVKHSRNKGSKMTCNSCFSSLIWISWMMFLKHGNKVAFQTYLEFWTVSVVKQRTTKLYIDCDFKS